MKNCSSVKIRSLFVLWGLLCGWTMAFAQPTIQLVPNKSDAVYQTNEAIDWQVRVQGDQDSSYTKATYVLKEGGGTVIGSGSVDLKSDQAVIHTSSTHPSTILAEITASGANQPDIQALAGAAVMPSLIGISSPCPADFDAFWRAKMAELAKVPANPVLASEPSGKPDVNYWKITLDNIRGTHIRGQLARPAMGEKLPAMVIFQYAGVYPLQKAWVTDRAAEGWLVLNVMAHDLPIDQPKSFYDDLSQSTLKNYTGIGKNDPEKSYFLRMFLACNRAVDYLSERPDWDGKTLVVTGASQGGLQSLVAAGLNHKVTAVMVQVPAGCDNTGALAGRKPGWPFWMKSATAADRQKLLDTCRYFDGVNFAARIRCPTLVGLGLIDTTAAPSGVFAAINQIRAPKEVVVMPDAPHRSVHNTHASYVKRQAVWIKAFLEGKPVPPQ